MQHTFRIGEAYHVEPSLNRVTGPSGMTRLEPKVMLVLVCLAERAGQMIPKDRLLHSAWADTAVGDDVLTRAISELRRLFEDDPKQPRVIETIPKSGYRLIAPVTWAPVTADHAAASPSGEVKAAPVTVLPRSRTLGVFLAAGSLMLLTAILMWVIRPHQREEPPAVRVVPFTVLPGHEVWPTFSPDGNQVAFEWTGETGENADIYIKMIGSSEVRRLTTDPASDGAPSWSPDGRRIAYIRSSPDSQGGRIRLMSPLGGSDLKLSDVAVTAPLVWSPDGRYLAAARVGSPAGLYLIPVDGGEPRPIVTSKSPGSDRSPAFSPDSRRFAYGSCATPTFGCDVYVLDLDAALAPSSPPRRLTRSAVFLLGSVAWTRDGRSVIYNAFDPLIGYLWRVAADGRQPPERIEVAGLGAAMPAAAPSGDRLAFGRIAVDTDVYRFQAGRPSQPVLASSFLEAETRFSPDGRRLAFNSMGGTDTLNIWVAAADGSGAQQLTRGPGLEQGSPWWSPDGRKIAFDSMTDDWHSHIWTTDVDGGGLRRLTTDPGDQNVPYWSRDGRWIYFSADRGNGRDIWRVPAAGGPSQQITRGGSGKFACESPDRTSLLYQPKDADSPLFAVPLTGGPARQLVACVKANGFAAGPQGVHYVACDPGPDPALHLMDPDAGRDHLLGRLDKYEYQFPPLGLGVSADGMSILYTRRIRDSFDLMVIENFR